MLRAITSTLTAVALAGTVGVLGQERQEPEPAKPANPPAAQPANQQAEKSTLTGCVAEAKTTDGSKAFVLNKVQGQSASSMYVLVGPPNELATHVNKRVEVTGPVQQPAPADAASDPKVLRPPLVRVESLKDVEGTCS
jgi:hypothetical protein